MHVRFVGLTGAGAMGIIIMEGIAKERKTRMLNREGFDLWADGYDRSDG